jgi:predicted O-methyltransferase YrrM
MSKDPRQVYTDTVDNRGLDMFGYLPYLRSFAKGRVLEIGVRDGISTAALLVGLEEHGGHLYSIDIVDASYLYNHPLWTFVAANSRDVAFVLRAIKPEPLDVLLIDGDHSREGFVSDLLGYSSYVRDCGLIICHDIDTSHGRTREKTGDPGAPTEAIREEYFKFVQERNLSHTELLGGWAGMGVIVWTKI